MGKFIDTIHNDIDRLVNERNYWIDEEHKRHDLWKSMQQSRCDYIGPSQVKLDILENKVQKQVNEILRLQSRGI